jgi:NADPH-dependent 2,4-dienoyl-CoA reductase/sulfur reductase-like enzyme/peroxiredoxin family protein/rhodanese-related sulfurtransferase/TusA-related sulfurtransferase
MKHVIIGGVAGGATAAARIRRADEKAEIILLEKGKYISYANCGLPYYLGGIIADRDRLFVQTPESFGLRFKVDVRVENEAIAIDTARREVKIRRKDGSEYVETYDKLLLSPGSDPVRPPLEGIDTEGIFTLRNVEDTDAIKAFMEGRSVRRAVIVGGGFIGLEMAENLYAAGAKVSIIEMASQVMAPVDFSIASFVHGHLQDKGVDLHLGKGVKKFEKTAGGIRIYFGEDETLDADLVLLSIGVRPNTRLAQEAGIALGERGIQVDKFLQTSAPDVYAVGDAIEYPHPLTGQPWLNFLAGPANRQARIVADNMVFGNRTEYEGSIGTSIAKVFDLTVGATGLAAKRLKQLNIPYRTVTTTSAAHASYYPKAFSLTLKIVFDPETGKLYGGQCVGLDGVDKRIDQLAIFIKRGSTVQDLCSLEQAYAPPFSSAKDPLAIAGYTASNVLNGSMPVLTWRELREKRKEDIFLLDVRTPEEYALGSIEGSVNIPLDELRGHLDELPRDKEIVIYCSIGLRGYVGLRILKGHGFEQVYNLTGGLKLWESATASPSDRIAPTLAASQPAAALKAGIIRVDACGLQCPGPILKLKEAIDKAAVGDQVEIISSDPGFMRDAPAWSASTGHPLLSCTSENGEIKAVFEKAGADVPVSDRVVQGSKNKTFIMFSDDLDRAIATFVLANGAAATGHKVSIFFTFWGLNVIKKVKKPAVKKDFFGKMFGFMLPSSSKKLRLSRMSMFGAGDKMMRFLMKKKNISSLEELRDQALAGGVEFIACQMSMDMMGIAKEELLDGVEIGGVATYMNRAENAVVNLFI